jgi:hypothetical protein
MDPDDAADLELGVLLAATKRLPPDSKAGVLLWSCRRHGSMATAE